MGAKRHAPMGLDLRLRMMPQRTLARYRYVAILGQILTIFVAYFLLGATFNLKSVIGVVALWAVFNVLQEFYLSEGQRLSDRTILTILLVDLLEYTSLLFLTAGFNNPFLAFLMVPALLGTLLLGRVSLSILLVASILALGALFNHDVVLVLDGIENALAQKLRLGYFLSILVLMLFLVFFLRQLFREYIDISSALSAVELVLQRESQVVAISGLVAAYAHEFGTPFAIMRLTLEEISDMDLSQDLRDEISVLENELARSSMILENISSTGKPDWVMNKLPLLEIIKEAVGPHKEAGIDIIYRINGVQDAEDSPNVVYSGALLHGLRNIIQNAIGFAQNKVEIEIAFDRENLQIWVQDDGIGFSQSILDRIGKPYLRQAQAKKCPEAYDPRKDKSYHGLGLGLFIAITLIETTKGQVNFSNALPPESGAIVGITWRRSDLQPHTNEEDLAS